MNSAYSKHQLSVPKQQLIELMQLLNFGRIEELPIRNGQPILSPPPRMVRDIKLGGDNAPRPELNARDFLLKTQVVELFRHLEAINNGTVAVLEVKHGLPFKLEVAQAV